MDRHTDAQDLFQGPLLLQGINNVFSVFLTESCLTFKTYVYHLNIIYMYIVCIQQKY